MLPSPSMLAIVSALVLPLVIAALGRAATAHQVRQLALLMRMGAWTAERVAAITEAEPLIRIVGTLGEAAYCAAVICGRMACAIFFELRCRGVVFYVDVVICFWRTLDRAERLIDQAFPRSNP